MTQEEIKNLSALNAKAVTTSVIQMEAVECGAASLKMILGYYGKHISLEKLREECGVNRDGSKAINIIKAARKFDLEPEGYKVEEIKELKDVEFPAIIHWNFNHFLVLEGFKKGVFYLNDPALGHRKVSYEDFNAAFTGVILTFKKTENFKKSGKKSNLINALKERTKGYEKVILVLFLVGLLMVIPGLVIPIFSRIFVDEILISHATDWIWPLVGGMALTALFRAFLQHFQLNVLMKAQNKLDIVSSAQYFWHVLKLPIQFFHQRDNGEIGSRIVLNQQISNLITGQIARNLLDLIVVVFYFALMLQYDVTLSIIALIFALMNIFSVRLIGSKRIEKYFSLSVTSGKLYGTTLGGIKTIETLKAMGRENDFFVKWNGSFAKVINQKQKLAAFESYFGLVPRFIAQFQTLIILILGASKIMDGQISVGMLVAFQSLVASFSAPISSLVGLGTTLQELEGDMNRIDDVMRAEPDPSIDQKVVVKDDNYKLISKKLEGYIEFKNVTFGYSKVSEPLISNLSLKINPGERIALVGGSGSGKSTVAKLLMGFYEPWEGEILFDGVNRNKLPRQVINNSLSMVSQDIYLFSGPLRDVLTLHDTTISDNMLINACKDANIHEVIASKPNAYDYELSEGGKNFSGGQRQRLEIARSLVTNPTMLVLDEATSALDPTTEKLIDENIKKRKCSVVVVAHRLSTIRDSDEIIVLDRGEIIERGTHEQLVKNKGRYFRLIKS
jgi:NHLM bacteriocin system ABC transporter peptidase/ATP-binding protein